MELFSEIYSCYYKVVSKILNTAFNNPLTKTEITQIIEDNAFSESAFYILPKLLEGQWNLMKNVDGKYLSKLGENVKLPVTVLQKAWLKALLSDKRIALFLKDDEIEFFKEYLKDLDPLFDIADFHYYDTFSEGDAYEDRSYIENFRAILKAIKAKTIVTISFASSKRGTIAGSYLPYKIEYSSKDDKFRVHAIRIRYGKTIFNATINISRITTVGTSTEITPSTFSLDDCIEYSKSIASVIIEISKERNAVERCMLHFANFEKRTEYDETTDRYTSYISYNKQDETELLIRILSFGPVIRVLGPEKFLTLVKERVERQSELLGI
ncbi:MAG: WYL domain-containing protein [Clostridiaceae bacterium]|nr:WYL domain-containing protein [Clostridiaceae bacterium]